MLLPCYSCRYQFVRFGRDGYHQINQAMHHVMKLLRAVSSLICLPVSHTHVSFAYTVGLILHPLAVAGMQRGCCCYSCGGRFVEVTKPM